LAKEDATMDGNALFPQVPQDLSGLDDEQLAALRDEQLAAIREVAANRRDEEVVGKRTQAEVTEELAAAVESLELVKAELQTRIDEAAKYDSDVDELAAKAGVELSADTDAGDGEGDDDGDKSGDGEDDEPKAEGDVVIEETKETTVTASSKRRPLPAATRHRPAPETHDTNGLRLTSMAAGAGAPYDGGQLLDRRTLAETMAEMVKKNRVKPGQRVIVASATYDYPEERILDQRAGDLNMEKVQKVVGHTALVAAGGLCAPLTPIYELPGVETSVRPVRDALASFQAVRGGVTVGATPILGDYDDAIGVVTAANNEAGGTFAAKSCMRIECPEFTSIEVDAIYHCIEADNLAARAYPELMARIDELVRAGQARLADSKLLTAMSAGSTDVIGPTVATGALYTFLGDVYKAAAGMRSRHRMPVDATLRAIFPAWLIDLLALDIARGAFDRFKTRDEIVSILQRAGINASFTLDGSSTATDGQIFAAQSAGALTPFPDTVEWFLYPEGSWLHLDAGVLELGIVRDSTLNSTNDFQIFGETWENVAFVGVESLVITSDVCPTGAVAAASSTYETC
jgi:hypothetical protein